MQKDAKRKANAKFFVIYHSGQVDSNGNPDLKLHRVERVTKELIDHQVLLKPFEEQFDLPALLVKGCNGQFRQV